jgi:pimeloyl-ACP methyl ester carboxylesterase
VCRQLTANVAISPGGAADQQLVGDLCQAAGARPRTVQLLVHGGTYNRRYWDWPQSPGLYSYVRAAVATGYATFSVDRLGAGASSHPLSTLVDVNAGTEALHGVVRQLRSGALGGSAFAHVAWVGHSIGSFYAWHYAQHFDDVDAFVLTGALHVVKPSILVGPLPVIPAGGDLDPGYITTAPGARDDLFYYPPTADPTVIAQDEATKDVASLTEFTQILTPTTPETAPSRAVAKPTLVVVGQFDPLYCGPPDGLTCDVATLRAIEEPYYQDAAQLRVVVTPATGHVLALHETAPLSTAATLAWLLPRVSPG